MSSGAVITIVAFGAAIIYGLYRFYEEKINDLKKENYFNSLTEDEKIEYNRQILVENARKVELARQKLRNNFYKNLYEKYKQGKSEAKISEDKYIRSSASHAGFNILSAESIRDIKTSEEFLAATGLLIKINNLIQSGFNDKELARKLIWKGKIKYSEEEIGKIRAKLEDI